MANEFLETLKKQVIILDGATGTMVQNLDLTDADFGGADFKMCSDLLCFSKPHEMRDIHVDFLRAGANAIETNTFGASPFRLSEYDFTQMDTTPFAGIPEGVDIKHLSYDEFAYHLGKKGAEIAREAVEVHKQDVSYDGRPLFVVGSIGPSNRVLMSTQADLAVSTFEGIQDNFYQQVCGLVDGGADVLLYETQQDMLELKAAIMGGQKAMRDKGVKLPIMAQVTVDQFSKMQIFNTDIHAALVTLQHIGIDVFGINCSIGPDLMEKTVETLARYAQIPISVIPNAGLPVSENGRTVFKFPPEEFGRYQQRYVAEYGVNVVGGCCGTTPAHIAEVVRQVKGLKPKDRNAEGGLWISGPQNAVLLDSSQGLIRFGERLNVRGSKKVRKAVEESDPIDQDALEEVVHEQVEGLGCNVIDVCMDSNTVDTVEAMKQVVHVQTTDFAGAMMLDSFQVDALAESIKVYPGRPVINSISMEESSPGVLKIDATIEAVEAHSPFYVGLCTGPKGPGATRGEKLDLAAQIIERAHEKYGVPADRIFIDVNCFPLGSESIEAQNFALETIEAIRMVKEKYPTVNTALGVGNLTNGLEKKPYMRKVLTSVFLDEARKRGLDAAIINPNHYVFVEDLDPDDYQRALRVILERNMDDFADLEEISEQKKGKTTKRRSTYDDLPLEQQITERIKDAAKQRETGTLSYKGHTYEYQDKIVLKVAEAMDIHEPLPFINEHLMGAMQELGEAFGRGEKSLPHLLKAADVMRACMGFLEQYMRNEAGIDVHTEIEYKGTIVLGTVYQDVHSIGKDLAKTLLENYGYRVIDLGTMVPLQDYLDKAKEVNADAIGMSALLVQTSNHMITVSQMMAEEGLAHLPILIGGAPVSDRHAAFVAMAGGDDPEAMRENVFYCRTAMDGVNTMNRLVDKENIAELFKGNKKKLLSKLEHAKQRQAKEEELLKTLPRRDVHFNGHMLTPEPRFRLKRVEYDLRDFAQYLDKKTLFSLNWRFGGEKSRARKGHTQAELEALFDQWIHKCAEEGWIRPQGVFGIYPCVSVDDKIIVLDPDDPTKELGECDFSVVIGSGKEDIVSGAQYFHGRETGVLGACGIQLTTSGPQIDAVINRIRESGDSESTLYLQGLSDRVAEDMADHLHNMQREMLGIDAKDGTRWSPGYPGMRDITINKTILALLDGENQIGVKLTDAAEYSPTGTTGAVVSYHPEARYS
ncbi:MAG: homocysteine S-methyltransferase family protein [Candidatus Hydrogenedentota bacterium]